MKYSPYAKQAVLHASGVVLYVAAIAWVLFNGERMFGSSEPGPLNFIAGLMLFIVSALTTGSLVLWQPAKLLVDGKKKEAGALLVFTGASLFIYLIAAALVLILIR